MNHFSLANPKGAGQEDVPALLDRVANHIRKLGQAHIHDITFHDEVDDEGNSCPTMTVYYSLDVSAEPR